MRSVVVTGAKGFIGSNLAQVLGRSECKIFGSDLGDAPDAVEAGLSEADVVFHLAGVNRPKNPDEFKEGNVGSMRWLLETLAKLKRTPVVVYSSSAQAALDNPYGVSKRGAEDLLKDHAASRGLRVVTFRFPGVFGKWCRPNYNSVVATFCHNIARDLPITINDPSAVLELVYIDDVVRALIEAPALEGHGFTLAEANPVYRVELGALAEIIRSFKHLRTDLRLPDFANPLHRNLYATYLSYLEHQSFAYPLQKRSDARGDLAEFLKSPHLGQVFVSRTRPGMTRGNHYHDSKVEKFVVLEGDAEICFRDVRGGEVLTYRVSGSEFKVVDIPPGYTHNIRNVGSADMVVLFWANEIFDPATPDAFPMMVRPVGP